MKNAKDLVRCAIDNGCVTNKEISDALGGLEQRLDPATQIKLHDKISDASRYWTLEGTKPGFIGRMYRAGKDVADKTANLATVVVGTALGAEYQAAKAFAGTILDGKLSGVGDHLQYWLGQKTVEVSGPEMMNAMYQMGAATPKIVLGMAAGAVVGWLGYKAARNAANSLYSRWRKNVASEKIVNEFKIGKVEIPQVLGTSKCDRVNAAYTTS
ncbi:hypothetical protein HY641_02755 [Candidatus Woesearchaeota archaeon]|nr:hypothetical protein [Candidatus Woesearchaeota archaeon]